MMFVDFLGRISPSCLQSLRLLKEGISSHKTVSLLVLKVLHFLLILLAFNLCWSVRPLRSSDNPHSKIVSHVNTIIVSRTLLVRVQHSQFLLVILTMGVFVFRFWKSIAHNLAKFVIIFVYLSALKFVAPHGPSRPIVKTSSTYVAIWPTALLHWLRIGDPHLSLNCITHRLGYGIQDIWLLRRLNQNTYFVAFGVKIFELFLIDFRGNSA